MHSIVFSIYLNTLYFVVLMRHLSNSVRGGSIYIFQHKFGPPLYILLVGQNSRIGGRRNSSTTDYFINLYLKLLVVIRLPLVQHLYSSLITVEPLLDGTETLLDK